MNLEDSLAGDRGLRPVDEQCERLTAARNAADVAGVPVFINARIDVWLRGVDDPGGRLEGALSRANAYVGAGADGIFVPGVVGPALIAALAERIAAPLNGVSRLTLGGSTAIAVPASPSAPDRAARGGTLPQLAQGWHLPAAVDAASGSGT